MTFVLCPYKTVGCRKTISNMSKQSQKTWSATNPSQVIAVDGAGDGYKVHPIVIHAEEKYGQPDFEQSFGYTVRLSPSEGTAADDASASWLSLSNGEKATSIWRGFTVNYYNGAHFKLLESGSTPADFSFSGEDVNMTGQLPAGYISVH